MRWMTFVAAAVLSGIVACDLSPKPGPAVRLSSGASDSIIVNSGEPAMLAVRAVDASGRALAGMPIRYERVDGADIAVATGYLLVFGGDDPRR
jgi:hypothetical protein